MNTRRQSVWARNTLYTKLNIYFLLDDSLQEKHKVIYLCTWIIRLSAAFTLPYCLVI